jgi:hypothetical protein
LYIFYKPNKNKGVELIANSQIYLFVGKYIKNKEEELNENYSGKN